MRSSWPPLLPPRPAPSVCCAAAPSLVAAAGAGAPLPDWAGVAGPGESVAGAEAQVAGSSSRLRLRPWRARGGRDGDTERRWPFCTARIAYQKSTYVALRHQGDCSGKAAEHWYHNTCTRHGTLRTQALWTDSTEVRRLSDLIAHRSGSHSNDAAHTCDAKLSRSRASVVISDTAHAARCSAHRSTKKRAGASTENAPPASHASTIVTTLSHLRPGCCDRVRPSALLVALSLASPSACAASAPVADADAAAVKVRPAGTGAIVSAMEATLA